MAKLKPIPIIAPQNVYDIAVQAPLDCDSDADKLRTLLDHFLMNRPKTVDMRRIPDCPQKARFTLRLPPDTDHRLSEYCAETLYTRQQAFQIAICTSLEQLGALPHA